MHSLMKKYGMVLKVLAVVSILLLIRGVIDYFNFDVISTSPIISALVGGVTFTIAIIFTGVLADYKESEKMPGELASSIKSLYHDSKIIRVNDEKVITDMQSHIKELLHVIISNFKQNIWKLREINPVIDKINVDIANLAEKGIAPQFLVKFRTELTNIDKLSNRIEIIMETTFIPAAYAIAELSVATLLIVLLFVKIEPYYEGMALIGVTSSLLIGLIMLIKDMDNPFEYGKGTYANVDLRLLFKLEEYFENTSKNM